MTTSCILGFLAYWLTLGGFAAIAILTR